MKNSLSFLPKWFVLNFLFLLVVVPAFAQNSKIEKSDQIEALVKSQEFIFKAQSASPMRGRNMPLTSDYDVVVSKDTIQTYLPYFGRAYMAQPYGATDGGIKITATDFKYQLSQKSKKRWNINIQPADNTDVQQLILSVSKNGYATLQVISTSRDPITFNGYIKSR